MKDFGKGIGTLGIWGGIAYAASIEPATVAVTALMGMIATIAIWND